MQRRIEEEFNHGDDDSVDQSSRGDKSEREKEATGGREIRE